MILSYKFKLFLLLTIGFIISVIIGTISHEFGHYCVAKSLKYDAHISYKSTTYQAKKEYIDALDSIKMFNTNTLQYKKYLRIVDQDKNAIILISSGGPVLTILIGTIGFLLLYIHRNKIKKMTLLRWILIFLSLFWLRQIALFLQLVIAQIFSLKLFMSDEKKICLNLHWPFYILELITFVIGSVIVIFVIIKFVLLKEILPFILAGIFGCLFGLYIWFYLLGPILLPYQQIY